MISFERIEPQVSSKSLKTIAQNVAEKKFAQILSENKFNLKKRCTQPDRQILSDHSNKILSDFEQTLKKNEIR